jgi:hypothetical protein
VPQGPSGLGDGFEPLGEALEGADRPVGPLALRPEQGLEAGDRLVGPLALGGEQRVELLDVGFQRLNVCLKGGD